MDRKLPSSRAPISKMLWNRPQWEGPLQVVEGNFELGVPHKLGSHSDSIPKFGRFQNFNLFLFPDEQVCLASHFSHHFQSSNCETRINLANYKIKAISRSDTNHLTLSPTQSDLLPYKIEASAQFIQILEQCPQYVVQIPFYPHLTPPDKAWT
jgi:hypothetical protein